MPWQRRGVLSSYQNYHECSCQMGLLETRRDMEATDGITGYSGDACFCGQKDPELIALDVVNTACCASEISSRDTNQTSFAQCLKTAIQAAAPQHSRTQPHGSGRAESESLLCIR